LLVKQIENNHHKISRLIIQLTATLTAFMLPES
jgi:hypothetical protein